MDSYNELSSFLRCHPQLVKFGQGDSDLQKRGGVGSASFFPASIFSSLVLEAARSTGVQRRRSEQVQTYLKRALAGKLVCVVGVRYGLLNKVFELFGARTYGVDIDDRAVEVARKRGLMVKNASAADLPKVFSHKKPHFIVSYQFFDPMYWFGRERELPKVLRGIDAHSVPYTIHLHQTIDSPTAFRPLRIISQAVHGRFDYVTTLVSSRGHARV